MRSCPPLWRCQLLRQPGSKVTLAMGQFNAARPVSGATQERPENHWALATLGWPSGNAPRGTSAKASGSAERSSPLAQAATSASVASPPGKVRAGSRRAPAASPMARTVDSQRCIPPPPCVKKGTTSLPFSGTVRRKVSTGGAMVPHQFGEPTRRTSARSRR